MALKGKKPEIVIPGKPKLLLSGAPGVGKTLFSLGFDRPYFIDCESGATRSQYMDKLVKSNGLYMGKEDGAQDFPTVIEQVKTLATTKHEYSTLVIDSFSKLYNLTAAIAEEKVGNAYGADKKEAQKPTRQLQLWLDRLDMVVILVCHSKSEWKNGQPTGLSTYDGYDKLSYDLDLWLEATITGKKRSFVVRKSRIEGFEIGNSYPLEYPVFADLYGKDIIEKPSVPTVLATPDQITEAKRLVALFNLSDEDQVKALKKYDVDTFEELTDVQIKQIIDNLTKKITGGK
jgi:hypothetical protein